MKRKLLFAVLCLFCIGMAVQAQKMCLNVNHSYGQERFALNNVAKITFPDGKILVTLNAPIFGSTLWEYSKADFTSFTFAQGNPTAIEKVEKPKLTIYPNPTVDVIYVETLGLVDYIRVYDLNGRLVLTTPPQGDKTMVNMAGLAKGMYCVKIGTFLAKVIKK